MIDDKYESYRLGYKRGHDRGYEFRKQQEEAKDFVVNRVQAENEQLKREKKALQHELDDKIQRIVVLRHVTEEHERREAEIAAGWL